MSDPDEHKQFQYEELHKIEDAMSLLDRLGISEQDPAYVALGTARSTALGKLGLIQPRTSTLVSKLAGLSPGEIRLFQDAERGWMVEAISEPGAKPVYKYVTDEVAEVILKGELTHEVFTELMQPEAEFLA